MDEVRNHFFTEISVIHCYPAIKAADNISTLIDRNPIKGKITKILPLAVVRSVGFGIQVIDIPNVTCAFQLSILPLIPGLCFSPGIILINPDVPEIIDPICSKK